jgi:hypothetical protein
LIKTTPAFAVFDEVTVFADEVISSGFPSAKLIWTVISDRFKYFQVSQRNSLAATRTTKAPRGAVDTACPGP